MSKIGFAVSIKTEEIIEESIKELPFLNVIIFQKNEKTVFIIIEIIFFSKVIKKNRPFERFKYLTINEKDINKIDEEDLKQVMEEYGVVDSVKIIIDRETGKSKGFAFVEMPNDAEGKRAIEELNEAEYEGRQMVVKEARPKM